MLFLKQSTASQSVLIGPFVDDTDGATAETGLTIANTDIRLSANGGNMVAKNSGGGTHDENGWYSITLDATDTATVGRLQLSCKVAGALPVFAEFQVVEEAVAAAFFDSSAVGIPSIPANWITAAGIASSAITSAKFGSGAITSTVIAADAIGSSELAATAASEIGTAVWATATRVLTANTNLNDPTAASIADAVWDEVISPGQHNVGASAAKYVREGSEGVGLTGVAQTNVTSTEITLASGAVTADDIFNGEQITIIEGSGAGQARLIVDSVSSTDICTVDRAWTTQPDNQSIYSIRGADVDIRAISGDFTAADNAEAFFDGTGYAGTNNVIPTVTNVTGDVQGNVDGTVASVTGNVGGVAGTITTLDALDTAQDTQHGTTQTAVSNLNDPTAAAVATAVLTTQMTESYAANGVAPTLAQAQFAIHQMLMQFGISSTNLTVRQLDDSTTAFVVTLDSASAPTDAKRV